MITRAVAFELPQALEATEPPEMRGLARDEVRLLVASRADGRIEHARFRDLPAFLATGDLLVVNTSATLPAALPATRAGGFAATLHVATAAPNMPGDRWWIVELRDARGVSAGERVDVLGGAAFELVAPYAGGTRLWLARFECDEPLTAYLERHGRPIRYSYVSDEWPLADYQTTFALEPGSAEMPSAGRPFTPELITRLAAGGVLVAPVTLHTGVSSPERDEPPYPERYAVPEATARLVNAVRGWGGRIVAVGTTAVRALESAADPGGSVSASEGWTRLVVTPERGLWTVDALITGWHEPQASHLRLLEAAAGGDLLRRSYDEALAAGYLWHEFGDSHLIVP
jgi:S-adenosylmethionine:tRNA ribosyltransferase-isomerase